MNKVYLVFMQDEYNNNYYLGIYKQLKDSIKDINEWLETYDTKIEELNEYPSTFGTCFDQTVETPNDEFLMIRGFVLDPECLEVK